jgi:hypothetical protein
VSGRERYRVELTEGQRSYLLEHGPHVVTAGMYRVTIDASGQATVEVDIDDTVLDLAGMAREVPDPSRELG